MPTNSDDLPPANSHKVSRRTLVKGAAWAVPAIAVASSVPLASASLPPCIGSIDLTGGTYPVALNFSGCNVSSSHWDFNFKISATANAGCTYKYVRVTFYDNPRRSRLWWEDQGNSTPQLYVQKVLTVGGSAQTFPTTGDKVYRADNHQSIGTITQPGSENDSLHVNYIIPGSGGSCTNATGKMATYTVEYSSNVNGPWTGLAGPYSIDPCVPMIGATACRAPGNQFKVNLSVVTGCAIDASKFVVTKVQRNNSNTTPTNGSAVWNGSQAVGGGSSIQFSSNTGSGNYLWISFTTDAGVNTSQIIINTPTSSC